LQAQNPVLGVELGGGREREGEGEREREGEREGERGREREGREGERERERINTTKTASDQTGSNLSRKYSQVCIEWYGVIVPI
jgi:hypothetical protein